jgi:hypothetical protein
LRDELETSGVNASRISNATLEKMLSRPNAREEFVVDVSSLEAGRALSDGRTQLLVGQPTKKPAAKRRATTATNTRVRHAA